MTLVEKMAREICNAGDAVPLDDPRECAMWEEHLVAARAALAVAHDKLKMDGHFAAAAALENELAK